MLKKILTLTFFTVLFSSSIFSQGLIIDHHCLDLSKIPLNYIDSVKANIKMQHAHTSHGGQINCGLELIEANNPIYGMEIGYKYLPQVDDVLCIFDGQELVTYVAPEGYWEDLEGSQWTHNTLNNNPEINVSMWFWCTQPEYYTSEEMQAYLDSISSFEEQFPNVQFVYTTSTAEKNGFEGYSRYYKNNMIRQYCINNDKVLFDFADLDCWYNGEMNYYIYNGDTIPVEHSAFAGDSCGHTNTLSVHQKAKAVWWMLARLVGWQREINIDATVYLEGSFNGTDMNTDLCNSGSIPLTQPFGSGPWFYFGQESVISIPNPDVVDWVMIELRDADQVTNALPETIVTRKAGFLLKNGSIVGLDGVSPLSFNISINENLYLVVRHQSHLDIIGANPASLSDYTYTYNFTISENQVYGGTTGYKEIAPGIWGMISGDGNGDGIVDINDKNDIWLNQSGLSGYRTADFDMGGKVDNCDKNDKWLENIDKQSHVPN